MEDREKAELAKRLVSAFFKRDSLGPNDPGEIEARYDFWRIFDICRETKLIWDVKYLGDAGFALRHPTKGDHLFYRSIGEEALFRDLVFARFCGLQYSMTKKVIPEVVRIVDRGES